ncbi:M48 family metallopeptidase [Mesobacterium sp. TK19101]|uniref:M48 family metallopeptidase n=1 Tax=Mesobacterium hydrothermale TaxID=3111907 RepID=A0ABU6HGB6_9RHOB|nr:M48 family metallopeptidase [Mesobacterium sp. TK19101]MEC3861497.1 M48 family metallopeptidase [Mesobacterium sp. TK19101]
MSTLFRTDIAPEPYEEAAEYLDGHSATPHPVTLRIDELSAKLEIIGEDIRVRWLLTDIREIPDQAGNDMMVLRERGNTLRRVILRNRSLAPRLPYRTRSAPVTNRLRLTGWAFGAVASVALIIFVLVPTMANQLANFIPPEGERALAEATLDQIRSALDETGLQGVRTCTSVDGTAALKKIETRLTSVMPDAPELTVFVLDHGMVNAFTLPGGYLVFFRGLLDNAGSAEQVAAVFAHEMGHVISRDPTRHALRSAGSIGVLGLLFGDFAGGAMVLFLTERLIDAQYSQETESHADTFAQDLLIRAGIAPSALADMFARFRALGPEPTEMEKHFLSHPDLGDRIASARAATPAEFLTEPVLTDREWQALQGICD